MKVLFLYNPISGRGLSSRQVTYINRQLSTFYNQVDYQLCQTSDELSHYAELSCGQYDILIFAGGDGTFHHLVNALKDLPHRPVIGIIPCGTLNDASKNFGYHKNIKQALKIIKNGHLTNIDIFKANETYGVFSLSVGTFSSIPYLVKHQKKKRHGRFAYYLKAFSQLFTHHKITGKITNGSDPQTISFCTSFILFLNSAFMGGFKINRYSMLDDKKIDLLFTSKGWFNGLFRYFFRPHHINHYSFKNCYVELNSVDDWDIDGEKMTCQKIHLVVLKNHLQVFSYDPTLKVK